MKRRATLWVLLAVLAAGAFWGTSEFLNSPTYALYQIGRGVHNRDPGLFLTYVDIQQLYRGQKDTLVDTFLPGKERDDTRRIVKGLLTALSPQITDEVKRKVVAWVADPQRDNLPSAWALVAAANINRRGDYALVVLSDPEAKERMRLGMRRMKDQPWRVVEINGRDLKILLSRHVLNK